MAQLSSLIPLDDVSMKYCHLEGSSTLLCTERCSGLSRHPSSRSSYRVKFGIFNVCHQVSSNEGSQIGPTELNFTRQGGFTNSPIISIAFLHCNILNIPSIILAEGHVLPQQVVLQGDVYSNYSRNH